MIPSNPGQYVTYVVPGSIAGGSQITGEDTEPMVTAARPIELLIKETTEKTPEIFKLFPKLVENGDLIVKDGVIHFWHVPVIDLAAIAIASITLFAVIVKFIYDINNSRLDTKIKKLQLRGHYSESMQTRQKYKR